jgi:hypothetical protein
VSSYERHRTYSLHRDNHVPSQSIRLGRGLINAQP